MSVDSEVEPSDGEMITPIINHQYKQPEQKTEKTSANGKIEKKRSLSCFFFYNFIPNSVQELANKRDSALLY